MTAPGSQPPPEKPESQKKSKVERSKSQKKKKQIPLGRRGDPRDDSRDPHATTACGAPAKPARRNSSSRANLPGGRERAWRCGARDDSKRKSPGSATESTSRHPGLQGATHPYPREGRMGHGLALARDDRRGKIPSLCSFFLARRLRLRWGAKAGLQAAAGRNLRNDNSRGKADPSVAAATSG